MKIIFFKKNKKDQGKVTVTTLSPFLLTHVEQTRTFFLPPAYTLLLTQPQQHKPTPLNLIILSLLSSLPFPPSSIENGMFALGKRGGGEGLRWKRRNRGLGEKGA